MYELIMTACSEIEAETWRAGLAQAIAAQTTAVAAGKSNIVQLQSPLTNEMRSIGAAFGKPGSFARRMSVHRSQTVGPMTHLNQVIIKNTQAVKDALNNQPRQYAGQPRVLPRSQSVATPSHVQTLAPRRCDRARIESLLADVWSTSLPYPGMTMRRREQLRGSANHVIRKLSMASITSTFYSKRSGSHTSMTKLGKEGESRSLSTFGRTAARENAQPSRLPLSELLPADFDLQEQPSREKRRNALRALTMTMERSFSPLLGSTGDNTGLKHTHSVREIKSLHGGGIEDMQTRTLDTPERFKPDVYTRDRHRHNALTDIVQGPVQDTQRSTDPDMRGSTETVQGKAKSKSRFRKLFG